jgi:hypothetical protein
MAERDRAQQEKRPKPESDAVKIHDGVDDAVE